MSAFAALRNRWAAAESTLCVGLDPDVARLPEGCASVLDFCRAIVDATADLVCAFKPQIAYFAAAGAEADLEAVIAYIRHVAPDVPVILDAKRGDIGPTAEQYAREAFDRYGADVVTVNPYLGTDSLEPFLRRGAIFALCRTSNPGSGDLQSLIVDDEPLYVHVARRAAEEWSALGEVGLVVGATYPDELRAVRSMVGDMPLLIPGVGAQGGDADATVDAGLDSTGAGIVVNSSRAVLYASKGADFAEAARREALRTRDVLRAATRR
jgi:orotidine-5'-phosphate decarboxylase